jgi:penicillin amidase
MTTRDLPSDYPRGIFLASSLKLCILGLAALLLLTSYLAAQSFSPVHLPGLRAPAKIVCDVDGIAHVQAHNEHDMAFLQGYVHAQDRLFQMDTLRREGSGTMAELVGPSAFPQDVQLRTLGLRRSADASLPFRQSAQARFFRHIPTD